MGILMTLLTLPVKGPIQGVSWIALKLAEKAEEEMYDEGSVRGQLAEMEMRYDLGEISEEEYLESEELLLARLREIREYRASQQS